MHIPSHVLWALHGNRASMHTMTKSNPPMGAPNAVATPQAHPAVMKSCCTRWLCNDPKNFEQVLKLHTRRNKWAYRGHRWGMGAIQEAQKTHSEAIHRGTNGETSPTLGMTTPTPRGITCTARAHRVTSWNKLWGKGLSWVSWVFDAHILHHIRRRR